MLGKFNSIDPDHALRGSPPATLADNICAFVSRGSGRICLFQRAHSRGGGQV